MISRSYAWLDETIERSEQDEARAKALAKKWSALMTAREEREVRRQSDIEDFGFDGPEPCEECEACRANDYGMCDGIKRYRAHRVELSAAEEVEIEIVEGMLEKLGARMMRPYEHWNEDERIMQYLEGE